MKKNKHEHTTLWAGFTKNGGEFEGFLRSFEYTPYERDKAILRAEGYRDVFTFRGAKPRKMKKLV